MAMQVATDLSCGVWPYSSAVLVGKVCSWPVLNLSHDAVSCPAELGLQAAVITIPHYTSGKNSKCVQVIIKLVLKINFNSLPPPPQYHSLFPHILFPHTF